jgi:uncharacterized DUF497 family protein
MPADVKEFEWDEEKRQQNLAKHKSISCAPHWSSTADRPS